MFYGHGLSVWRSVGLFSGNGFDQAARSTTTGQWIGNPRSIPNRFTVQHHAIGCASLRAVRSRRKRLIKC